MERERREDTEDDSPQAFETAAGMSERGGTGVPDTGVLGVDCVPGEQRLDVPGTVCGQGVDCAGVLGTCVPTTRVDCPGVLGKSVSGTDSATVVDCTGVSK